MTEFYDIPDSVEIGSNGSPGDSNEGDWFYDDGYDKNGPAAPKALEGSIVSYTGPKVAALESEENIGGGNGVNRFRAEKSGGLDLQGIGADTPC